MRSLLRGLLVFAALFILAGASGVSVAMVELIIMIAIAVIAGIGLRRLARFSGRLIGRARSASTTTSAD